MNNFFITGFPRSRTAWLANFFTHKDSYCFHELSKEGGNVYELVSKLHSRPEPIVGTSDCAFPFYYKDILQLLPESKIVIVERDVEDVKKSLAKFVGAWNDELEEIITTSNKKLNELTDDHDCIFIGYEELEEEKVLKSLYYQLGMDNWDHERWKQLDQTNVQLIKEKWLPNINVQNMKSLLGV